jgi:hypothetical protein
VRITDSRRTSRQVWKGPKAGLLPNAIFFLKLFETTKVYQCGMSVFFTLLGVAMIAYRVFVKGESIIVKNPNWKMRGLACLVIGLLMVTASLYGLIILYLHHVPILGSLWVMLVIGIVITAASARMMMRVSPSQ